MNQMQGGEPAQSALTRAGELVNRTGQRFGLLAALAGVRVLQTTLSLSESMIRQRMTQLSQPKMEPTKQPQPPRQAPGGRLSPPERDPAEQAVERMGQQFGSFTTRAGRSAWSLGARLGEEARDIWMEAQAIRHEKGDSPRP